MMDISPEPKFSMSRAIILSLAALVMVMLVARSCGLTPGQMEDRILLAELNAEEGSAYRTANRRRPGVVELADGLQVEMLELGAGPVPTLDDWVALHYRGLHIDGRVFEDSYRHGEPAVVPVEQTIVGWRMVLTGLPVGSVARLVVPPSLAYGAAGAGPVGPEETLVFELNLVSIVEPPAPRAFDPAQQRVPGLRGVEGG
jgi:FKBP-type peptidyl-prolyl cis-trans isomerase FkpA